MHIEQLQIWGEDAPDAWVRDATNRWAHLLVRAALIYLGLFEASPISRTETEILFLLFVEDGEKSEPAVLADRLHVSRQTMTGLLDRLESNGFVTRQAHPTDRRRKVVLLSERGLNLIRDAGSRALRRDAGLIATFPEGEVSDTLDLMERLCGKVEEWTRAHPLSRSENGQCGAKE